MHFFGAIGSLMFIIGFLSAAYIGIHKLINLFYLKIPTILVNDNPWFYISLTTMIIGTQFFLAGFLGEIMLRSKRDEVRYKIKNEINLS